MIDERALTIAVVVLVKRDRRRRAEALLPSVLRFE